MTIGQVYVVPQPGPALEREMASENQVEHLFAPRGRWSEDPHPSVILRTRSEPGHQLGDLYEEMVRKDADLAGIVRKRSDAVLALPRTVEPDGSSPDALAAAELCRAALAQIPSFATVLEHLLGARARGIAIAEVIWHRPDRGPLTGQWVPLDIIDRPMRRFAFRERALHVRQARSEPILAPPGKFLAFTSGTKDQPWGDPLMDRVYWYWWIKKHAWKWWAVFVEKWAAPTAIGKYPWRPSIGLDTGGQGRQADEEMQGKLLAALKAFQTEMAIAIPDGLQIDLKEATRSGSVSYGEFAQACTRGMALVFLGEINTSGLRPGVGAFASEEISHEISREKVRLDAHDLSAFLRDQLLRPLVALNLGEDVPVPRLVIDVLETEQRRDRMDGVAKVLAAGQPVPRRHFYGTHLVPEPREDEEVVEGAQPSAASPFPGFPFAGPRAAARGRARLQATPDLAEAEATAEERDVEVEQFLDPFRAAITAHYARHRELVEEAWTSGAAQRGEVLRYVLARIDPRDLGETLLGAQAHGIGLTLEHLIEDGLGAELWSSAPGERLDLPLVVDRGSGYRAAYLQAPPPSATTWSTAVDWWARLLSIGKSVFEQYEDDQRRLAFTVAGLEEASVLRDVHALVREALAQSMGLPDFRVRLAGIYEAHGLTPTSDWHADLILNNNVRQAGGAVRWRQIVANPEGRRLVPYLAWHTLGDDRVRDRPGHNHAAMAGRIFAADHTIWRTWWYPAGHGCRCYVSTIAGAAARRMGLTGSEPTGPWPIDRHTGRPVHPDLGFRASPNIAATVDEEILPRLEEHAAAAESAAGQPGAEDLIAAIRQLLDGLVGGAP